MDSFASGDILAKHQSTKQTIDFQNLICEICYNTDEFSLCGNCFNKFNSKILRFKANTKKDNFELSIAIKEYIEKRKSEIEKFHKISARKSNIQNINKLINATRSRVNKNKQNLESLKTQKQNFENNIYNLEENTTLLNNSNIEFKKCNSNISEILQKKISEKIICDKNFFKKLLNLIFCGNKIFLFAEIFEKDEYVLPSLDKAAGSRKKFFNDFSNILSTEAKSFDNFCIEDHKKSLYFEKHLKTKDSVINYNMNPYPYSADKTLLKQHEKDFFNKLFVYEINNYVHKLLLFAKIAAKYLNIKLPCDIESESNLEISDNFDFSCESKKLLVSDNYANFNESATFAAMLALDKSIKFIKDYLTIKVKKSEQFSNYYNSNNYKDRNSFEILGGNYNKNNYNGLNCNNPNNYNFNNNEQNYFFNANKHANNENTNNNDKNSPRASFNVVNKPNFSSAYNNMEFNVDFLNITSFYIFCGEKFEVQKFSKDCEIIKNQTLHSNLNKSSHNNNINDFTNKEEAPKNNSNNSSERTYELLNEKGLVYNVNNIQEKEDEFVFEEIEITEEILTDKNNYNDDKLNLKFLQTKKKNEEEQSGFVIIEDYFDNKK